MENVRPWSKSKRSTIIKCPWVFDQEKNHNNKSPLSPAARIGLRVNDLFDAVGLGRMTHEEAMSAAETPEIRSLLKTALDFIYPTKNPSRFQARFAVDMFGNPVPFEDSRALLRGITDLVEELPDTLIISDLKTGREYDDSFERDAYVAMVSGHYPNYDKIAFKYLFARTGTIATYHYDMNEWDVMGFLDYLTEEALYYEDMDAEPTPGSHCLDWYGSPCRFLDNGCPANKITPEIAETLPAPANSAAGILRAIGAGEQINLGPATAGTALSATIQMRAFLKKVEDHIKAWAKDNNETIRVSDAELWGFTSTPRQKIDKKAITEILFNSDLQNDEIMEFLTINADAIPERIDALPGDIKAAVQACITPMAPAARWGRIK